MRKVAIFVFITLTIQSYVYANELNNRLEIFKNFIELQQTQMSELMKLNDKIIIAVKKRNQTNGSLESQCLINGLA